MGYWSIFEKKRQLFVETLFKKCEVFSDEIRFNQLYYFNTYKVKTSASDTENLLGRIDTSRPFQFNPFLQKVKRDELNQLVDSSCLARNIRNDFKIFKAFPNIIGRTLQIIRNKYKHLQNTNMESIFEILERKQLLLYLCL